MAACAELSQQSRSWVGGWPHWGATAGLGARRSPVANLLRPLACHVPAGKAARVNLVQTQPFASTFGRQSTRKRPKLSADSYADMLQMVRRPSRLLPLPRRAPACPPAVAVPSTPPPSLRVC